MPAGSQCQEDARRRDIQGSALVEPIERCRGGTAENDEERYVEALKEIGPSGYGAVARHLMWGATRAGKAETILRLTGRIVYDRSGRGRPVDGLEYGERWSGPRGAG